MISCVKPSDNVWIFTLNLTCFCPSPPAVCGSHHRAAGHQRQEPAVHRVRGRQQRQDPRQRALRSGGGGLVNASVWRFTDEQRQYVIFRYWRSIRSPVCQIPILISWLLHVNVMKWVLFEMSWYKTCVLALIPKHYIVQYFYLYIKNDDLNQQTRNKIKIYIVSIFESFRYTVPRTHFVWCHQRIEVQYVHHEHNSALTW